MRRIHPARAGFGHSDTLLVVVIVAILAVVLVARGGIARTLGFGIVGFVLFGLAMDWLLSIRPGTRVKVRQGTYAGVEGVVHGGHDPNDLSNIYVILRVNGKEVIQPFSRSDIKKLVF